MEGRNLDKFLEDQKRYEEERKVKKEKLLLEKEEQALQMQKSKMNANSRRILERKQLRAGESGDGTKIVNG